MAKNALAQTAEEQTPTASVPATVADAGVPAHLASLAEQYAGAGTSQKVEDNLIPFLVVLQDMSPQVKKRDPKYIEGAEPGYILQTANGRLYSGETGLLFQPCFFQKMWVEWIPRSSGGGFVAAHGDLPADATETTFQGDDGRDRTGYRRPNGNDVIETRYEYGHILADDGSVLEPVVIGFSSTGHTASRQWMVLKNGKKLGGKVAPAWFCAYRLKTIVKKNAQGEWFVLSVADHSFDGLAPWIPSTATIDAGTALYEAVSSGARAAAEPAEGHAAAGAEAF